MKHNYDDIVLKYYHRLQQPFLSRLTHKYPSMSVATAEDIYQDAFVAVQENIRQGRVRQKTDWDVYILTIGFRMASKQYRDNEGIDTIYSSSVGDDGDGDWLERRVDKIINGRVEDAPALCNNPEVLKCLADELERTPELCRKIIKLFYYNSKATDNKASMADIAEDTGLKNAQTAKTRKNQCMNDFVRRLTESLHRAGINITPKK